jgi:hypothetical protein
LLEISDLAFDVRQCLGGEFLFVIFADAAEEGTDDENKYNDEDDGTNGEINTGEKPYLNGVGRERPSAFVAGTIYGFDPPIIGSGFEG